MSPFSRSPPEWSSCEFQAFLNKGLFCAGGEEKFSSDFWFARVHRFTKIPIAKVSGKDRLCWLSMCWLSWFSCLGSWWCSTSRALSRSLRLCPWKRICFHGPVKQILGSAAPTAQTRDAQHKFLQHRPGAHTESHFHSKSWENLDLLHWNRSTWAKAHQAPLPRAWRNDQNFNDNPYPLN